MQEFMRHRPIFEDFGSNYGLALACPHCGDSCGTHHDLVEVFEREDDARNGLHVTIHNGKIKTDSNISNNPSSRRQGIAIRLYCESGCNSFELQISQHKGQTFFNLASATKLSPMTKMIREQRK